MSYPRVLQSLVIEDESQMVETYQDYFRDLQKEDLPVAPPRIAPSLDDAKRELARDGVLHLVILDLRLPVRAGSSPDEASALGLELLSQIEGRERYPVPVLLVVTGDLNRADPLESIRWRLEERFSYGKIVRKGQWLHDDLRKAIDAAWEYCDVGVHVLGGAADTYPLISPREEDLLRRSALAQGAIGIDLRWWSAEHRDRGVSTVPPDWVKVLQGRFILPGDAGMSRPRFFKFESQENGKGSQAGATLLAQKLNHVGVIHAITGPDRHLLVTDKAGPSSDPPLTLTSYLMRPTGETSAHLAKIALDIATQLRQLGDETNENLPVPRLFWEHLDAERLSRTCKAQNRLGEGPTDLFRLLGQSQERRWCKVRTRHGDLHLGNVSLDLDAGAVRAFLIDPGSMKRGPVGRDFATLEVSLLLHQRYGAGESLVIACADLYDGSPPAPDRQTPSARSALHENTRLLLRALRAEALAECPLSTYVLLLIDEVFVQLGGLTFGTSQNKIFRKDDAEELFSRLRNWHLRLESRALIGGREPEGTLRQPVEE